MTKVVISKDMMVAGTAAWAKIGSTSARWSSDYKGPSRGIGRGVGGAETILESSIPTWVVSESSGAEIRLGISEDSTSSISYSASFSTFMAKADAELDFSVTTIFKADGCGSSLCFEGDPSSVISSATLQIIGEGKPSPLKFGATTELQADKTYSLVIKSSLSYSGGKKSFDFQVSFKNAKVELEYGSDSQLSPNFRR